MFVQHLETEPWIIKVKNVCNSKNEPVLSRHYLTRSPHTVIQSLIRNGWGIEIKVEVCQLDWNHYQKSLIGWWIQIWIFLRCSHCQSVWRRSGERCKSEWALKVEAVWWFGDAFQTVLFDILSKVIEKYHRMLIPYVIPSGKCLIGQDFIFQHNMDRKHTASAVKAYLDRKTHCHGLTSPEPEPQHCWGSVASSFQRIEQNQPTSKEEL